MEILTHRLHLVFLLKGIVCEACTSTGSPAMVMGGLEELPHTSRNGHSCPSLGLL